MEVEELNNERKRQKLSIAELAEKANLPKATVEKILFGIVKHPRIDTMQAIEHALGLDVEPNTSVNVPDKYGDVFVALNNGDKELNQDDVEDIIRFIEFKKSTKK